MKIEFTFREILWHGCWDKFCDVKGYNPWMINEGTDGNDTVVLTVEEIRQFGLSGYVAESLKEE